jgi:hypothetical protein
MIINTMLPVSVKWFINYTLKKKEKDMKTLILALLFFINSCSFIIPVKCERYDGLHCYEIIDDVILASEYQIGSGTDDINKFVDSFFIGLPIFIKHFKAEFPGANIEKILTNNYIILWAPNKEEYNQCYRYRDIRSIGCYSNYMIKKVYLDVDEKDTFYSSLAHEWLHKVEKTADTSNVSNLLNNSHGNFVRWYRILPKVQKEWQDELFYKGMLATEGEEGGICYGNNTCNEGLECKFEVCHCTTVCTVTP